MQIYGLNKTTLLDYPHRVAATVFCGGCNFRCPFCHNSGLVLSPGEQPRIPEKEILEFLKKRRGILTGVCVTGGEPTLQKDLGEFLYAVKDLGYLVKLDTNGYRPEVLERLVEGNLVDDIAMDIKSGPDGYALAAGIPVDMEKIYKSIDFIKGCGVQYEFRTTVVRGIHRTEDFAQIGPMIRGCGEYYLQAYRENENVMQPGFASFTIEEMKAFAEQVAPFVKKVSLRGIEE